MSSRRWLLVAALLLAGCGGGTSDGDAAGTGGPATTPEPATTLTITLDAEGDGDPTTTTLTCDPPGGDHPDPAAACAQLAEVGVAGFALVPADAICTQVFGGPQVAGVSGTVDGEPVDASFDRTDGCRTSRWDRLATVLQSGA